MTVLAGVEPDEILSHRIVADAVGGLPMPGRAPEPEIWFADGDGHGPCSAILREPGDRLMPGCGRLAQGNGATEHQLALRRDRDLGVAQIALVRSETRLRG